MQVLRVLLLTSLAAGCSLTEIDFGAGQIPEITVDGTYSLPAQEVRTGGDSRSWSDSDGNRLSVVLTPLVVRVSSSREVEFLTHEQTMPLKMQVGEHAGAVKRVDAGVLDLRLHDMATGIELKPEQMGGQALIEGTSLGPSGYRGRVSLGDEVRRRILAQAASGEPITLELAVAISIAPDRVDELPSRVQIHLQVQPILVVQALEAL